MFHAEGFTVGTRERGTYEVTDDIQRIVRGSGVSRGLCTVFLHHTSASLILCENADPSVRRDLERFFAGRCPTVTRPSGTRRRDPTTCRHTSARSSPRTR